MSEMKKRKRHIIRESIKFQLKLTLDAGRDLLLSPVAIACTVIDLLIGNSIHNGLFQRLMQLGHNTDRWLNLFGDKPQISNDKKDTQVNQRSKHFPFNKQSKNETHNNESITSEFPRSVDNDLDSLFSKLEALLHEQHEKGGLTLSGKQKIQHYLDKMSNSNIRPNPSQPVNDITNTTHDEDSTKTSN